MQNFLDYASRRYFEGNPIIPDEVFDRLAEEHKYQYVGHVSERHGVPHTFPMYSLKKCYVGEKQISLDGEVIETPKLDGAAIALTYVDGSLSLALTRGDGKRGEDITEKAKAMDSVPSIIQLKQLLQITGEVVAPKVIPNARNYAAGALNLKNIEEFNKRSVYFIAYGITPSMNELYTQDMSMLHDMGFAEVYGLGHVITEGYPTDGKVFRLNSNKSFDNAGYTSSHPRGAYALKKRTPGVVTQLKDVTWQVGRTGAVSPVAILEPVKVGDATVSRATLHNMRYIEDLGLELGCDVEIIRSGEIISRVVRRV